MKKLLLCIVLFISFNTFAQDYIPFLNNTVWCETVADFGWSSDIWIMPAGTETIGGYEYVKYPSVPFFAGDVYLREDVAQRRVYRMNGGTEVLLYDFSLQVNDQFILANGGVLTVTSRDSVPVVTGRKRLRINLQGNLPSGWDLYESWTEGVGTYSHPVKYQYEMPSDPAGFMTCSFTDGQPAYNRGLQMGNPVVCEMPSAATAALNKLPKVLLYPNPVTDRLSIITTGYFNNASLALINTMGQTVRKLDNINGNEIILHRESLAQGLYLVAITQNGETLYTERIVVQN